MATVFLKTLSIFAITVVGYIITKKGILPKETEPGIVNLLLLITTPCMIFNSLVTKELDPSISGKITFVILGSLAFFIIQGLGPFCLLLRPKMPILWLKLKEEFLCCNR